MIGLFEFVMVLESIIIGLGLAEILTGRGELLRARRRARVSWVHTAVVALVLLSLLQHWWDAWELRFIARWSFPGLLFFLTGPILLFLLAYVALPQTISDTDLEEYYFDHSLVIWALGATYLMTTLLFRPVFAGADLWSVETAIRGGGIGLCVLLM